MIRILFLADTHLGEGLAISPGMRLDRIRSTFFKNFHKALEPAFAKKVDFVVHGGDVYYRSKFPDTLIYLAFERIKEVAELGIPFIIVPGNHERSKIKTTLFTSHPNIHIFSKPSVFRFEKDGTSIAFAGFSNDRNNIHGTFRNLVKKTGWQQGQADINLLCMHQTVEGAQVGAKNFTFKYGSDVIPGNILTKGFSAYLSGHIHRHQILTHDLRGVPFPASFIYAGSTERTSAQENSEEKGYLILEFEKADNTNNALKNIEFFPLPSAFR